MLAAAIAIAATTGLRRGELAGLRWSDVDLDAGRLHVRRAIKNDLDGAWIAGPPKTHQARRVALDAFTLAVLSEHRARASVGGRRRRAFDADGYVLTLDPPGVTPIRPDTLSQAFAPVCQVERITEGHPAHPAPLQRQHADRLGPGRAHHRRAA